MTTCKEIPGAFRRVSYKFLVREVSVLKLSRLVQVGLPWSMLHCPR